VIYPARGIATPWDEAPATPEGLIGVGEVGFEDECRPALVADRFGDLGQARLFRQGVWTYGPPEERLSQRAGPYQPAA
jgi:hypothetical protein